MYISETSPDPVGARIYSYCNSALSIVTCKEGEVFLLMKQINGDISH